MCAMSVIPTAGQTSWLGRLMERGGPQLKKASYAAAMIAAIVWLSWGLLMEWKITTEWNLAFTVFMSAATTGYLAGKKIAQGGKGDPNVTKES